MVKDGGYTAELFPIRKEEQGEVRRWKSECDIWCIRWEFMTEVPEMI